VKTPKGTTSKKVKEVFERSKNTPMSFKISGKFGYISTKQQTYWDVKGTIFGFCIPNWQEHISGGGLRSCFLAEDKTKGGRVRKVMGRRELEPRGCHVESYLD
jgi:alpha-acetolactate decarboxylase